MKEINKNSINKSEKQKLEYQFIDNYIELLYIYIFRGAKDYQLCGITQDNFENGIMEYYKKLNNNKLTIGYVFKNLSIKSIIEYINKYKEKYLLKLNVKEMNLKPTNSAFIPIKYEPNNKELYKECKIEIQPIIKDDIEDPDVGPDDYMVSCLRLFGEVENKFKKQLEGLDDVVSI